jgi:uncharacterized membrane protein affecting hemolysin expression
MFNPATFFLGSKVKIIIALIVLAIIGSLAWTAKHYHNKYIAETIKVAEITLIKDQALVVGKVCSDNTQKLREEATAREEASKKAIAEAQVKSAKNKSFANEILVKTVKIRTEDCRAGDEVLNNYLREVKERENEKSN